MLKKKADNISESTTAEFYVFCVGKNVQNCTEINKTESSNELIAQPGIPAIVDEPNHFREVTINNSRTNG